MFRTTTIACLLALATAGAARADDPGGHAAEKPFLSYSFYLGLAGDRTLHSDAVEYELYDINPESTLTVDVHPADWLGFHVGLTFETVRDLDAWQDRYFGDLGLYVDTLNMSVEHGGVRLVAGKFTPGFGTAWDATPGIYGTEFVEEYQFSEMIGAGLSHDVDLGAVGTVTAAASLFFADTTILSDSLFTRRGRTRLSDGGPGNTGRLDNAAVSLDGSDIDALPGFGWHLGYIHLSAGEGDEDGIDGWAAGVTHEVELPGSASLTLNGEFAHLDGGVNGSTRYFTAGASVTRGPWHGELARTVRNIKQNQDEIDSLLLQVSGGHRFEHGVDLSAGYAYRSDPGTASHRVGLRLTWSMANEISR